jgi:AcrR family transcriptional regulator
VKSTRKEIQTARMWRYFLDAASDLIEEKGLHQITVREIADRAGYTSSTVYNYFRDLSHLKFFAVMRYTNGYFKDLPLYMDKGVNTVDKWLYAWECFCRHSFQHPEIYSLLYIENLGNIPEELVKNYYQVYANELINLSDKVQSIISQHDIATRSSLYIQNAIEEGFFEADDIEYIADMTMLIWTGMLTNVLNLRREISNEEAAKQTMQYIHRSILQTVLPEKRNELTYQYGKL